MRYDVDGLYGPERRTWLLQRIGWRHSPLHYRLFRTIEASDGYGPTVYDLADVIGPRPAHLDRLAEELRADGLIARHPSPVRRGTQLLLTPAGQQVMDQVRSVRTGLVAGGLVAWPPCRNAGPRSSAQGSPCSSPPWPSSAAATTMLRRTR